MIYTTLLNIAVFQGIVLGFIILKSSIFNSNSNKYLAGLLFTLSIILLNHVFEVEDAFTPYPFLRFIDHIEWTFLIAAFIFLFIINRIDDSIKSKQKSYLCFIPFAYTAILNIACDLDRIAGLYTIPESGSGLLKILSLIHLVLAITFMPFLLCYSYFMLRHLKDPQEKNWIFILLTIVSSSLFAFLIIALANKFFPFDLSATMSILAFFATFIIHWTAYIGIYKYKLAKDHEAVYNFLNRDLAISPANLQIIENDTREEYSESITAENLYFQELELLCKEQHIYTDSTLNREKVAEKLGISPGYVSLIVNTITEDNFANYINKYRVEAVKEMISNSEYENYNLLAMGLESGFTSKTTFYKAFKKLTGQTPNEYKNNLK
ncbi:helix-turn-helix domain-containing protein [Flavobacterium sp. CFBP9031]|uniref:helix-turn-helix domain-containing protein n=1 Tax=Flavobacterium sp. CFBP9031 TaxID=3096538 RepID=UPI002A6A2E51|nr:helix-turn-helix domain-containing protein [Flavobacterium sp. CFBP9031]MDY0987170.1 helix-turn-helix domain-containing protein [Flavobacterium sp. CFBP9031]